MPQYYYKAPWAPYSSMGTFKNRKEVASFIKKLDTRYKQKTTKQLIDLWNIFKTY